MSPSTTTAAFAFIACTLLLSMLISPFIITPAHAFGQNCPKDRSGVFLQALQVPSNAFYQVKRESLSTLDKFGGNDVKITANLGNAGVGVGVDSLKIAGVDIDGGISVVQGGPGVLLKAGVVFETGSTVQNSINKLVSDVLSGGTKSTLNVFSLLFGSSSTDLIKTFSTINLPLNMNA
ncbi:hypothetical protein HDU76_009161, partial [Blyttiomyces sp. JEL0837]